MLPSQSVTTPLSHPGHPIATTPLPMCPALFVALLDTFICIMRQQRCVKKKIAQPGSVYVLLPMYLAVVEDTHIASIFCRKHAVFPQCNRCNMLCAFGAAVRLVCVGMSVRVPQRGHGTNFSAFFFSLACLQETRGVPAKKPPPDYFL